jgi:hypothetical protein
VFDYRIQGLFSASKPAESLLFRTGVNSGDTAKRLGAFLHNHGEVIVAFDFFTVPTVTFQLLFYCFFVIEHGRRKNLHCNMTRHQQDQGAAVNSHSALSFMQMLRKPAY